MKMRFWLMLCCLVAGGYSSGAEANPSHELIEQLPAGQINWTLGTATSKGCVPAGGGNHLLNRLDVAFDRAVANLQDTVVRLRMDGRTCVADIMPRGADRQDELVSMVSAARIVQTSRSETGMVEVTVRLALYGGFAQLMLPNEIRQVEPIKPLIPSGIRTTEGTVARGFAHPSETAESDAFSGLVVDARGIQARPCLVPRLIDENGQEVYSPAFVSREYAVQFGMCQYRRSLADSAQVLRVAPRPLIVRGLRTSPSEEGAVVISNADAARLRGSSAHLDFLKQCRVIIVLD